MLLIGAMLLTVEQAQAQLRFQADSLYLGKLRIGQQRLIEANFAFVVEGTQPVRIIKVESDCACAAPWFSDKPVAPGAAGAVLVRFDPYRPGYFEKRFLVHTDARTEPYPLVFAGVLEPEHLSVQAEFPHTQGSLRLKSRVVNLGVITSDGVVKRAVELFNESDQDLHVLRPVTAPRHIEVVFDSTRVLKARSRTECWLFYHPDLKQEFGYVMDNVRIPLSGSTTRQDLTLEISATIRQSYSETLDPSQYPRLLVSNDLIDLGEVRTLTDHLEARFTLYNNGPTGLVIHKVLPDHGCQLTEVTHYLIPPFSYAYLTAQVRELVREGTHDYAVTIFSNDPENPVKKLVMRVKTK